MRERLAVIGRHAALYGLLFLVAAASFYYGAVEAWASEWLRFGVLLIVGIIVWTHPPSGLFASPAGRVFLPLALLLVWAALQSLPLPSGVLSLASPKAAELYRETVPDGGAAALPEWLLHRAEATGVRLGDDRVIPEGKADPGTWGAGRSISLNPDDTREAILAWITPLLLFLAAAWIAADPDRRYRLFWGVTAIAGAWGLVAFLQRAGWDGKPLWTEAVGTGVDRPSLPFINRNHYAGFVNMACLTSIGLFFAILTRATGRLSRRSLREALLDRAWAAPRLMVTGLCALFAAAGVVLSGSRGGLLSLLGGLAFFAVARSARGWLALVVAAVVLVGLGAGVPAMSRGDATEFQQAPFVGAEGDSSGMLRMDAWAKTQRMFLDYPLTGTGLGTFRWGFSMYQRQGEWMIFKEAHNDYLQLLAETGLIGIALAGWALFAFLWFVLRPALGGRRGRAPRFTTIGAAAGRFALFIHSILDFNLQIPSNAALFVVLLGVVAAAARDASVSRRADDAPAAEPARA